MTTQPARVTWLASEHGGRRLPPSGPRYVAPARFESQAAGPAGANWRLVIERMSQLPGSVEWIGEVRYLADEAPQELLSPGARFELYEGKKCVARGVITTPMPAAVNQPCARPTVDQADAKRC